MPLTPASRSPQGINNLLGDLVATTTSSGIVVITISDGTIAPGDLVAGKEFLPYGTSFPSNPADSDLYYRTDRGMIYCASGVNWLSTEKNVLSLPCDSSLPNATATSRTNAFSSPVPSGVASIGQLHISDWAMGVTTGATNTTAAHVVYTLHNAAGTAISTITTSGIAGSTTFWLTKNEGSITTPLRDGGTDKLWRVDAAAFGAPSAQTMIGACVTFRWVG